MAPLPVEGTFQPPDGGPPQPAKDDGDWRPKHMDPKLQSLLRHCGLELWVPLLEAEFPKAVEHFDLWMKLGEEVTRDLFKEVLESLYKEEEYDEKLPPDRFEKFINELYPKKPKKAKAPSPSKAKAAAVASTAKPAATTSGTPSAAESSPNDVSDATAAAPPAAAPPPAAPPAEEPITDVPASERWTWEQDTTEVRVLLRGLPMATKPKDVKYTAKMTSVTLSVHGEVVLDKAELDRKIISDDVDFELTNAKGSKSRILTLMLPKIDNHPGSKPWEFLLKKNAPNKEEQPYVETRGFVDPQKVGLPPQSAVPPLPPEVK